MPYLMLGLGILFVLVAANAHAPPARRRPARAELLHRLAHDRDGAARPGHLGGRRLMERMVVKKPFAENRDVYAEASPVTYVRENAPPFFVIHGSRDSLIPAAEARRFVERLRAVSAAPVVYAEMQGAQHGFDVFPSYRTARVIEGVERYLTGLHRQYRQGVRAEVPDEISESLDR